MFRLLACFVLYLQPNETTYVCKEVKYNRIIKIRGTIDSTYSVRRRNDHIYANGQWWQKSGEHGNVYFPIERTNRRQMHRKR